MTSTRSHYQRWACLLTVGLCLTPIIIGCGPEPEAAISETRELPSQLPQAQISEPAGSITNGLSNKITFRKSSGSPAFSLQFKSGGGKLIDQAGKVITSLILEADGALRLTDSNNKTVGYVIQDGNTVQIEDAKQTKVLFSFVQEADGNALLLRSDGSTMYKLSAIEGGYAVESDKTSQYQALTNKGTGQLQTPEGERIVTTDSEISPEALASFGFEKLSQAQRAGLAYALTEKDL